MLLGQIFLASLVLQPPQTPYMSALNHIIQCLYLFCWAWLEMTCSTNLESNSLHKNMPSCLSISSGLPNYKFHQIQDKFKKLGKYAFAQIRSCGLASACHLLPATAFWGNDSQHQRSSSSYGSILLGKMAGKRGQGSHFLKQTPRFPKH